MIKPVIGNNCYIHHSANLWGCTIGDGTKIGAFCDIGNGVVIGRNCRIQAFAFIPPGVIIGDNVFIGPRVTFTNDKYLRRDGTWVPEETYIENGARIGAGACLLPIRVGTGALVSMAANVLKDVAPNTKVVGNPAREIY